MGVIISLLLGGFAQENLGALMSGQACAAALRRFNASLYVTALSSYPYQGYTVLAKPAVGMSKGMFSGAVGWLLSPVAPSYLAGTPITADASMRLELLTPLSLRPRISILGPTEFNADDPFESYKVNLSAAGGLDLVYAPFDGARLRPLLSLGATAGYAWGWLVAEAVEHTEPLKGFGAAADASLAVVYAAQRWSLGLEGRLSYGTKPLPRASILFLW